jgi:hypothetical protein
MHLPEFTAEAGLYRPSRPYYSMTFVVAELRTNVSPAKILSGICDPSGSYSCGDAWDTCQYYAAATSHSGADVSNCCQWWVLNCHPVPPSSFGDGGAGKIIGLPEARPT